VPDQDLLTSALASELAALTGRNAG
jgi:hypothetical protein